MSLPPVVSDPEGPCPGRELPGAAFWDWEPHDWEWRRAGTVMNLNAIEVCRYCGRRKP